MNRLGLKTWLVALSITILSIATAYYQVFSGQNLSAYDDEGMLMIDIKRFLEGRALYDDVGTIYGPLYYFYEWVAHAVTGAHLTHDSVRFVSMFFWVVSALVIFFLVRYATGSILVAACCHFLVFHTLSFIAKAPAHPQELCSALLAGIGLAVVAISSKKILMPVLGAFAAALVLTKINLGVFAILAIGLGLLSALHRGRMRLVLLVPACTAALALPLLIMRSHFPDFWALEFCAVTLASVAAAIVAVRGLEFDWHPGIGAFVTAILGFAAALAAISWFPLAHGSTLRGMVDLLILTPQHSFGKAWFLPSRIPVVAIPWALAGLCCAVLAAQKRLSSGAIDWMKMSLAIAVGLLTLLGFHDWVMSFAPPFLWLAAIPPQTAGKSEIGPFARAVLVFLSTVQVLYAYPVAGDQVPFTNAMLLVLAAICFADSRAALLARLSADPSSAGGWKMVYAAALAVLYVFSLGITIQEYRADQPLHLPGTSRMRIDPKQAQIVRDLAARIDALHCTMLASVPGLLSFNFLTGTPAPRLIHFSAWMLMLPDDVQEATVTELSKEQHPCVLYNQSWIDFWTRGADPSSRPLVRYIKANFSTVYRASGYELMEYSEQH